MFCGNFGIERMDLRFGFISVPLVPVRDTAQLVRVSFPPGMLRQPTVGIPSLVAMKQTAGQTWLTSIPFI